MRLYIGKTVTSIDVRGGEWLALDFGPERIFVPLGEDAIPGPEGANVVGVDELGRTDPAHLWVF